jgi:hypothetical protein
MIPYESSEVHGLAVYNAEKYISINQTRNVMADVDNTLQYPLQSALNHHSLRNSTHNHNNSSRDSSVSIATGCTDGVRFPARARDFSLLHSVQTASGAHPVSYTMDSGVVHPGKVAGA